MITVLVMMSCATQAQVRGMKRQSKMKSATEQAAYRYKGRLATEWVDSVMRDMNLRQQVAQLMCIRVPLDLEGKAQREFEQLIRETEVGGVCFFVGTAQKTLPLIKRFQYVSRVPLLVCIDAEWGMGMRLKDCYAFPKNAEWGLLPKEMDTLVYAMGREIGRECRQMGIRLLPPDINESGPDFTVAGEDIRFGLAALKGVGRGFTAAVLRQREKDGPFRSFPDFCRRLLDEDLNKRVLESLIRAGAFDSMGLYRSQLLDAYEQLVDSLARSKRNNLEGQFDLFSMGGIAQGGAELALRDIPEFSSREKMAMEKEVTGLYLSGHPMDSYREEARTRGAVPIGALLEGLEEGGAFRDEQKVALAGMVASVRTRTTRSNSLMAYVGLEDESGEIELLVFARTLEACRQELQENSPVLAAGRISVRDDKPPQLMCDQVWSLDSLPADLGLDLPASGPLRGGNRPEVRTGKLYLRLGSGQDRLFERVRNLFQLFPGSSRTVIYFADTGRKLGATCLLHEALLAELILLLGEENVILKEPA